MCIGFRLVSNRASAKRSRQRKHDRLQELELLAAKLRVEQAETQRRLAEAQSKLQRYARENAALKHELAHARGDSEGLQEVTGGAHSQAHPSEGSEGPCPGPKEGPAIPAVKRERVDEEQGNDSGEALDLSPRGDGESLPPLKKLKSHKDLKELPSAAPKEAMSKFEWEEGEMSEVYSCILGNDLVNDLV